MTLLVIKVKLQSTITILHTFNINQNHQCEKSWPTVKYTTLCEKYGTEASVSFPIYGIVYWLGSEYKKAQQSLYIIDKYLFS